MRLFIAVALPARVLDEMDRVSAQLRPLGLTANFVKRENMHVTILFLGEVPEEGRVIERLKAVKVAPFDAKLSRLGVFPNPSFVRVIWCGVEGHGFTELHNKAAAVLARTRMKNFTAHVTLARVKALSDKEALLERLNKAGLNDVSFRVNAFQLMSSRLTPQGPVYSVVQHFLLAPQAF